jgi:glycosyltransferase involved in cell wall biosynthesis
MKKIIRISTVPVSLEVFLKGFLRVLSHDFEVVAVSSPGEKLEKIHEREGVRTVAVPMERHIAIFKDMVSLFRLIRLFAKERPDMVHSLTPKAGLLAMLAAWITGVPVRVHTFTGLVFPTSKGLKLQILILMDKVICACATFINPEGKGVARDLKHYHITNKPLHIIANGNVRGVDMNWYDRTNEVLEHAKKIRVNDSFTFCFVGRLVRDKGVNELAQAFDHLSKLSPRVRLILIGGSEETLDPLSSETKEIIQQNKRIDWVGHQSDIRPFLAASDAFVFPSYREGFPNGVLEAGALGLPAIVTDINGCNEIIIQGENGEIIPPRDENALYEKMKEWVEQPEKLAAMASKARGMVESRFEQSMVWNALLLEYKRLLDRAGNNVK